MPRFRVVAAVVLALALMVASCSDDSAEPSDVDNRQQQLKDAYNDGEKARQSIDHYDLPTTEDECKAHYNATVGEDLGSDDMVDLGRHYFVKGCMKAQGATGVAQGPERDGRLKSDAQRPGPLGPEPLVSGRLPLGGWLRE
jgi:hypothetical protein